jgi:hypothetical protein
MAVFTIKTSQYVTGSRPSIKLAEFELIVRHHISKKNLFDRTKKAKLESNVLVVGEVDVYDDRLYIELHNFDFVSPNATQYDSLQESSSSTLTQSSVSEKRSRLYETLTEVSNSTQQTKRQKTSDTKSNTTSSPADYQSITDSDNANQTQPDKKNDQHSIVKSSKSQKQPVKRELRSSNTAKKISNLATTNLDIPAYNEVE